MLLAVDIGNTNIKLALFKGQGIFSSWRLATDKDIGLSELKKRLKGLFRRPKAKHAHVEGIIICSVVPKLTLKFKQALFALFKSRPLILGQDIIAPIKNLYKKPEEVGQDRLANALAVFSKYGGPIIVVDFGTAVTFDAVSAKGSYLGGVIVPGMELALSALIENADLLPKITLGRPRGRLGRETASSMKSGMVYGYSFLVEGILQQLKEKLKLKNKLKRYPLVIATGGEASLMAPYCSSFNRIEQNLTLEGLRISYQRGKKQQKR